TLLISHHRMPATPPEDTLRLPTRASCPSWKRRYAERNIGRSPMPSSASATPAWGTQPRVLGQRELNPAGDRLPPLVKVELAGVIVEVASQVEVVAVVAAGGIARCGDGHALVGGHSGPGELADHPPVGELVVHHYRVAVSVGLAHAAEAAPYGGDRGGAEQRS